MDSRRSRAFPRAPASGPAQIVFIRGYTVYTLTYPAPPDKFDANAAEAQGIMSSLKQK